MSILAQRCLQASIVAMCLGTAGRSLTGSDGVFGVLFMTCGWSEPAALAVSRAGAWGLLGAALLVAWRCWWLPLLVITGWMLVLAVAEMLQRPVFGDLIPGGRAARYLAPVALLLLARGRPALAVPVLRIAASATFFSHGLEALSLNAAFLDLLFRASEVLVGTELPQPTAEVLLRIIGVLDLLSAAAILLPRGRVTVVAAAYMATWGLLTALSRTIHSGVDGLWATLERVPNGGVPLALLECWSRCRDAPKSR